MNRRATCSCRPLWDAGDQLEADVKQAARVESKKKKSHTTSITQNHIYKEDVHTYSVAFYKDTFTFKDTQSTP